MSNKNGLQLKLSNGVWRPRRLEASLQNGQEPKCEKPRDVRFWSGKPGIWEAEAYGMIKDGLVVGF